MTPALRRAAAAQRATLEARTQPPPQPHERADHVGDDWFHAMATRCNERARRRVRERGCSRCGAACQCPPVTGPELRSLALDACPHCGVVLVYGGHRRTARGVRPRNDASVDRIDVHRAGYGGNARWWCHGCNTQKGGWDLAAHRQRELEALQTELGDIKKQLQQCRLRGGSAPGGSRRPRREVDLRRRANGVVGRLVKK